MSRRTVLDNIRYLLLERVAVAGIDDLRESGDQHRGTCPHCGKPDRFMIGERADGDGYWVKCYAHCQQRDILDVLELDWRDLRLSRARKDRGQQLRLPDLDSMRPVLFAWGDRIPNGRISALVGNEGTGKGTVIAYLASGFTRGRLEGDLKGRPCNVLILGSEDLLDSVWTPRLYLAGADLDRVFFQDVGDFEVDFTDDGDIEHLRVWIRGYQIKVLILDALLDHVGGAGTDEYKPRQVRAALAPLRRLAGEEEIAVLGSMHPRKGKAQTFRELMAASHQFNAVSRSSMLLAPHPEHDDRRVLALGKSNHAGRVSSLEFRVEVVHFELNGYQFRDVRAVDWCESAIDLDAAMQASMGTSGSKPSKVDLAGDAICEVLEDGPRPSADVKTDARRKVGCGHATIERAAAELREDGVIGSWGSSNRTVWFLRNQSSSPGESEDEEEDDQTDKSPVNMRDSGDSSSSSSSDPSPVEEVGSGERNGSVGADESARVTAAADLLRRIQEMDDQ